MLLRNRFVTFIIACLMVLPIFAQEATSDIVPCDLTQTSSGDIQACDFVEGDITDEFSFQRFRFVAVAGQTYTIRMERVETEGSINTLDPYLYLLDSNERVLTENDDMDELDDSNRNAQIIFTVAESEDDTSFIIEATRFEQGDTLSEGRFRLFVIIGDVTAVELEVEAVSIPDALTIAPEFGVEFTILEYDAPLSGLLDADSPQQYFALGGQQGEVFKITVRTANALTTAVTINFPNFTIPFNTLENEDETSIQGVIPQTGWYLIEVAQQTSSDSSEEAQATGSGDFTLEATVVGNGLLDDETPLETEFEDTISSRFFVVNTTINEGIFVNMTVLGSDNASIMPSLTILPRVYSEDQADEDKILEQESSSGNQTNVRLTSPRSGPYILRADNLGSGGGSFQVSLRRTDPNTDKLRIQVAQYNENYSGTINDRNSIVYYRFSGKAGELVSIQMQTAETDTSLDPFLILTDSNLNELAFNDNTGATPTARIAQYALPADGDYFILATRPRLSRGSGEGDYDLSLTVGQIALQSGSLTATLEWQGDADLNLFVRAPSGRTVSWANPQIPDGGNLQIDSNTRCETPTAQPVEHIFWPETELDTGDYVVWVWYQNICATRDPITFTLTLAVDGKPIVVATSTPRNPLLLRPGERYETGLRVLSNDSAIVTDTGTITIPSPQQTASQGGDILLVYSDEPVNGAITNEVFAQFYQFHGNVGDVVRVCVQRTFGNLDPIVVLRDSLDNNLAANDDAENSNCDSELIFTLPETDRYVIAVTRFGLRDGTTVGEYNLTLTRNTN